MRFQTLHQLSWDWRAAGNFILGGAGSALLVLLLIDSLPAQPQLWHGLLALALMGAGLGLVWLEIGRPWRALNVFFHPETSWMTREAIVALVTFALAAAGLLAGMTALLFAATLTAAAFLYCQGRILEASKGIPAWREPLIVPLVVATGLTEGAALLVLLTAFAGGAPAWLLWALALLAAARGALWVPYRERVCSLDGTPPATRKALDRIHLPVLGAGSGLPLLLLALAAAAEAIAPALAALAAVAALAAGWWLKLTVVTRAAQVQGFALGKLRKGHPLGLRPGRDG